MPLLKSLAPGEYRLAWRARTSDGQVVRRTGVLHVLGPKEHEHGSAPLTAIVSRGKTPPRALAAIGPRVIAVGPETAFDVSAQRDVATLVVDVDRFGLRLAGICTPSSRPSASSSRRGTRRAARMPSSQG